MTSLTSQYYSYIPEIGNLLDTDDPLDVASVWRLHNNARHLHDTQGQMRVCWSELTSQAITYNVSTDIELDYPWRHIHSYVVPWSTRSDGSPLNAVLRLGGRAYSEYWFGVVVFFTTVLEYKGYMIDYMSSLGYEAALTDESTPTMLINEFIDLSATTDFSQSALHAFVASDAYNEDGERSDAKVYMPTMRIAVYGCGIGSLTHVSVREAW
jgi:hypothetical protein